MAWLKTGKSSPESSLSTIYQTVGGSYPNRRILLAQSWSRTVSTIHPSLPRKASISWQMPAKYDVGFGLRKSALPDIAILKVTIGSAIQAIGALNVLLCWTGTGVDKGLPLSRERIVMLH